MDSSDDNNHIHCNTNQDTNTNGNVNSNASNVNPNTNTNINNQDINIKKQFEEYISSSQLEIKNLYETIKNHEITIENKYLKQQVMELKEFIKSGKAAPTYNISIKKYIQQNYSDAPPLEQLANYSLLQYKNNRNNRNDRNNNDECCDNDCDNNNDCDDDYDNCDDDRDDDNDDDFISTLSYNYNNNALHKYIGDFIIKYYKKDNPSQQSMWTSDMSRLTYVIKELLSTNESIWNRDYKGIKTKKYVIDPILKYIKDYIDDYCVKNLDKFKNLSINKAIQLQRIYVSVYQLKKDIDSEIIANNIIKYISPHFYMDRHEQIPDTVDYFIDKEN